MAPVSSAGSSLSSARRQRRAGPSDLLRDHGDRAGRALLDTDPAALAVVEVDLVLAHGAQLDHGVVRAQRVAVVAGEAAAAGQAAACLEERSVGVEAVHHLVEGGAAPGQLEPGSVAPGCVLVVPGVQCLIGRKLGFKGWRSRPAGQPGVDAFGAPPAVADRDGDGPVAADDVATGEDA